MTYLLCQRGVLLSAVWAAMAYQCRWLILTWRTCVLFLLSPAWVNGSSWRGIWLKLLWPSDLLCRCPCLSLWAQLSLLVTRVVKALSHKMTVSQQDDCPYLTAYKSEVLMSKNVLISHNYVIKLTLKKLLVQIGGFMMWWNDNDF